MATSELLLELVEVVRFSGTELFDNLRFVTPELQLELIDVVRFSGSEVLAFRSLSVGSTGEKKNVSKIFYCRQNRLSLDPTSFKFKKYSSINSISTLNLK